MKLDDMRIPAIVLTFDRNRRFTENMILSYQNLWPRNPFRFFIPYQENMDLDSRIKRSSVSFIQTKPGIRDSVLTLLENFEDGALVYWAIDDKFPVSVVTRTMDSVFDSLLQPTTGEDFEGLLFTRARSLVSYPGIERTESTVLGHSAFRVRSNSQFWLHQLVRVGRLRAFFESLGPISEAKKMDDHVKYLSPPSARFVLRKNALVLEESTSRGIPTKAALLSLQRQRISDAPRDVVNAPVIRTIGKRTALQEIRRQRHDITAILKKGFIRR